MHTAVTSGDYIIFYIGFGLVLVMAILVVLLFVRAIRNMILRHRRRKTARLKRITGPESASSTNLNKIDD